MRGIGDVRNVSHSNVDLTRYGRVPVVSKSATDLRTLETYTAHKEDSRFIPSGNLATEPSSGMVGCPPEDGDSNARTARFRRRTPEEVKKHEKFIKKLESRRKWISLGKTCWTTVGIIGVFAMHLFIMLFWLVIMRTLLDVVDLSTGDVQKRHGVIPRTTRLRSLSATEEFIYFITDLKDEELSMEVKLEGPFFSEPIQNLEYGHAKMEANQKQVFVVVVERWKIRPGVPDNQESLTKKGNYDRLDYGFPTGTAKVIMNNYTEASHREPLDFNNYPRSVRLSLPKSDHKIDKATDHIRYAVGFGVPSQQNKAVPFNFGMLFDRIPMRTRIWISIIPACIMGALPLLGINPGVSAFVGCAAATAGGVRANLPINNLNTLMTYMDFDIILYVFSVMMIVAVFVETRFYSFMAFHFLKGYLLAPVILINLLSFYGSMHMNNILIVLLLTPLVIRMMEIMQLHPQPLLINMAFMCNIGGRAYVGTLSSKLVFNHKEAINNGVTMFKYYTMLAPTCLICGIITFVYFHFIYTFLKPQLPKKRVETTQNDHLVLLWNRASIQVVNVSRNWHVVKGKMNDMTERLKKDLAIMRYRNIEVESSWAYNLATIAPECTIHNWFLLAKGLVVIITLMVMLSWYIYNYHFKHYMKYDELRLGFIGLYTVILLLLLNHARDLELMMKRVDWQSLMVIMAIGLLGKLFKAIANNMDDYVWKLYGATMEGTQNKKILNFGIHMLCYSAATTVFSEHLVVVEMLDTILTFAKGASFNAINQILGGFLLATGIVYANTSIFGSFANLVMTSAAEQQGYRIRFYEFMLYGIPVSIINFLIVFFELF